MIVYYPAILQSAKGGTAVLKRCDLHFKPREAELTAYCVTLRGGILIAALHTVQMFIPFQSFEIGSGTLKRRAGIPIFALSYFPRLFSHVSPCTESREHHQRFSS